jgi:lipopolysaccharide biosynthesis regulator YciM
MAFERATRRGSSAVAVLLAVLARVPVASAASPEDPAAARQHLKQAEQLRKKGQLAEACQQLEEVERLDPKLPTLLELAECTEKLGKVVEAQAWWSLARDAKARSVFASPVLKTAGLG